MIRRPPRSTLFPYTALFRSLATGYFGAQLGDIVERDVVVVFGAGPVGLFAAKSAWLMGAGRVIVIDHLEYRDRKSTRLNSSHANISYAVFCLIKNKKLLIHL